MAVSLDAPPAAALTAPREQERVRRIRTRTTDDTASLVGAALGGAAFGWLLTDRVLPSSGAAAMIVIGYVTFLALYAAVSWLGNPATVVADRMAGALVASAALTVVIALSVVIGYTFWTGRGALRHLNLFTRDLSTTGPLDPITAGGVLHAVAGTLIMISIAVALTVPLGIACAVYLSGVGGRGARLVRTVVESMTALPSIVAGLFIYVTVILLVGLPRSGLAAALAISVMMLPIIARASEVVLRVVPGGLREASLALGASQWRTVWSVVLPTARPGLTTAVILGTARGLGETAPVLLTAGYTTYLNLDPLHGPMVSLPLFTFFQSRSPAVVENVRAFGAASVLLVLVFVLFAVARMVVGRAKGGR